MAPKQASTLRRASSLSKVSTPADAGSSSPHASTRPNKPSKSSKIVRLPLPKEILQRFPYEKSIGKASQAKVSPLSQSTSVVADDPSTSTTVKSDPESTPAVKEEGAPPSPTKDVKAKTQAESKTSTKRGAGVLADGQENGKSSSTQRKRPRTDPNKPDGRTSAAKAAKGAAGITTASHKLGPKANQGAINAGLRALDRTTKQCRQWNKTGFRIKSFTGRAWEIPSWRAPTARNFGSESENGTSNDPSKENSSSNVGSDKSPAILPSNVASSPAPVATPA